MFIISCMTSKRKIIENRLLILTPLDKSRSAYKNVLECPLDYSFHKKHINKSQHEAGIKFRIAYEKTTRSTTPSYDLVRIDGSSHTDITQKKVEAIQDLIKIQQFLGKRQYYLAVRYCAEAYTIKIIATDMKVSRNKLSGSIKTMLNDLAGYYGL